MKSLWRAWRRWTFYRAWEQAEIDKIMYGTSFIKEYWWGFRRVDPFKVVFSRGKKL